MPKALALPRPREYPMTHEQIRTTAQRMTAEAKRQLAEAEQLSAIAGSLSCYCGGAIMVPRRKNGSYNTEAAYIHHTMTCRVA